jgi:WD40 repeat protein
LPAGALARIGSLRLRHDDEVVGLAFSADGKVLASVSFDETIRLWDVATGKERRRIDLKALSLHTEELRGGRRSLGVTITLAADGKTIAFTSPKQTIHVHDTATGQELRRIQWRGMEPGRVAPTIALSTDGKLLAARSFDTKSQVFRIWDIATGKELLHKPVPPEQFILRIAFSPDSKIVAVCPRDISASLWETATGKELHRLGDDNFGPYALAFTPDGKALAGGGVPWKGSSAEVRLWDTATGKETIRLRGPRWALHAGTLAISPDGTTIAAASDANDCCVWDLKSGKKLKQFGLLSQPARTNNWLSLIALSGDGKTIAWTAWSNRIHLTDARTGRELLAGSGQADVKHFALSPDGKTLASVCTDGKLRLWNTTNGEEVRAWKGFEGPVSFIHFTPDGKTLITLNNRLQRWNVPTGEEQAQIDATRGPHASGSIAVSADGKLLAVGADSFFKGRIQPYDCKIDIWDLTTGKLLAESQSSHKASVTAVAFSPDGKWLISTGVDRTLRLWQTKTGQELNRVENLTNTIERLVFAADGRTIVGAAIHHDNQGKRSFHLVSWEVGTWKERQQREGPAAPVLFRTFSDDGQALAYTDADGALHVETVADGKELGRFQGHQGEMVKVLFSRDRRVLATAGRDGTILIWDLSGSHRQ